MNPLQESISKCTVSGNVVTLPKEQLDNYADVRKAFLQAGAVYKRNTFVFPKEAQQYVDQLLGGAKLNRKKDLQFYGTPPDLADQMVKLADVKRRNMILEPSAGQGALIEAIRRVAGFDHHIHYCEIDDVNRAVLSKLEGLHFLAEDFLKYPVKWKYDLIIANPPFSKNQDIDHIMAMYDHLEDGGQIVTVASNHWVLSKDRKCQEFKDWVYMNAEVIQVKAGTFKSSGTMVESCILNIYK